MLVALCWPGRPVVATLIVEDIVSQVSQASYTDYLDNALYTHFGDNRGSGPQHDLARNNIYAEFQTFGLNATLEPFTSPRGESDYNVVAVLPGSLYSDRMYLVGAHYDSVDNPGADDNASGVAGILEAARVLSQYRFENSIVFVAFDREETGLAGSRAYVQEHLHDNILAMISMDMIAYNSSGADRARIYGSYSAQPLKDSLASAISLYGNGLSAVDSGPMGRSDHEPFQNSGFQACLLIEYDIWDNPHYHRYTDSVDTPGYIDYAYATNMVRGVVGFLAESAVPVPEPASLVLFGLGALVMLRKHRSQAH